MEVILPGGGDNYHLHVDERMLNEKGFAHLFSNFIET